MADQENNGNLQNIQDELNDSDDDDERDFGWHELDWSEDDVANSDSIADTPEERSGHVAVADGNCMYVWGGYKNAAEAPGSFDLYLPSQEIWIYSMETGRWRRQLSGGDLPNPMSGSCGACVEGILYIFGGHHARGNTNLVYRLNLRASDLKWERMNDLEGLPPTRKDKLGCWVYMSRLVYFGGYGYEAEADHRGTFELDENSLMGNQEGRGWNNHIHILNLETSAWSQPITKGNAPTPRAAHACASIGNRGYVFGGRYMDHRLNDLYNINMDTWEWTEMSVSQHSPVGRSWHSFITVSSDRIFLFGGFTTNRETLSDAWLYCVTTNEWKQFNHNYKNSPRFGFPLVVYLLDNVLSLK